MLCISSLQLIVKSHILHMHSCALQVNEPSESLGFMLADEGYDV